jgi:hypothetical protein
MVRLAQSMHLSCTETNTVSKCNILGFRATKNMSFLKFFLQLCEACSIYVEPESNSLTRRCIHVELVAGVCWCSWVGFVLSCGVRSTQVHSNLLSNSLWIHLWVSLENPPLNLFMNPHFEFIPSSLPNLFPILCEISRTLEFLTNIHLHLSQTPFENLPPNSIRNFFKLWWNSLLKIFSFRFVAKTSFVFLFNFPSTHISNSLNPSQILIKFPHQIPF